MGDRDGGGCGSRRAQKLKCLLNYFKRATDILHGKIFLEINSLFGSMVNLLHTTLRRLRNKVQTS